MNASSPTSLNSALYWFPRIAYLGVPETRFVTYDHASWVEAMESGERRSSFEQWVAATVREVRSIADELGYPLFVRSDQTSAKHSGPESYLARDAETVGRVLWATVEDNELKLWMDREQPTAFMLRQFLELQSAFVAFGGHPIAREWRYFVRDGAVACRHFYWPEDALTFYGSEPQRWKAALAELRQQEPPADLTDRAAAAGVACTDHAFWSVDFAQDRGGEWWLIDMAIGERSWHPECAVPPEAPA